MENPKIERAETVPSCGQPGRGWLLLDRYACLACMLVGLGLAVAPYLATLARYGTLDYVADGDDVLYLAVGLAPYHGELGLRDPFSGADRHLPSLHAWMQFVPLARLTRWLGLPPVLMSLVWRAVGGPLLGTALYVLFRRLVSPTRHATAWALGLSLVCLADSGFVSGRCLIANFFLLGHIHSGTTPMSVANAMGQYRVVTPLLNFPFLLLLIATLHPSAPRGPVALVFAIVCLGLCYLLYFFFWTAAVLALGGYLATVLLFAAGDRHRRAEHLSKARFLAAVLAGGTALGLPQVYFNARTFSDVSVKPILERQSKGARIPPGSPIRSMYLRNGWAWGKIVAGALAIVVARLPGLGLLWWFTVAGFVLTNSAVATGLEFENYHWHYVSSPIGEILLLAAARLWLDRPRMLSSSLLKILWVIPVSLVSIALVWRPYEAISAPEAAANSRILRELKPLEPALNKLGPGCTLAGGPETNIAFLHTRCGLLFQDPYTIQLSQITDRETWERHALNGWLLGLDVASYERIARPERYQVGLYVEPRWDADYVARSRLEIFKQILDEDGGEILARYHPDHLLQASEAAPPRRGGRWVRIGESPRWALWARREPASPDRSGP
jgi:hypothetical protein